MSSTTKIDDGGPAFPIPATHFHNGEGGMTLRDYFAASIDIPWNACLETIAIQTGNTKPTVSEFVKARAEIRYLEADAMIAALKAKLREAVRLLDQIEVPMHYHKDTYRRLDRERYSFLAQHADIVKELNG